MEQYVDDLKNNENCFVFFNKDNFDNYIITDGLIFDYKEFILILHFLNDFYDFDIYSEAKENEYMIFFIDSIAKAIGYNFCGFYPKLNCKYLNTEIMVEKKQEKQIFIKKIREIQENRFAPNRNNKRVICFHNGNGEFRDGISLNPIVFGYKDFVLLRNFCFHFCNFDFDLFFHGKNDFCFHILDEKMQSFFQRRIICSTLENRLQFSDEEYKKISMIEKNKLIEKMRNIKI